ncbi:MAG: LysR family transcriptional regulator, partial [Polaromonas sp.]|nr:LysR family transcriptional regulator [Polaromonas sp.]
LPRWVRAFRERHPQVQLELVEATGDVQLQLFGRGEIDAGFMLHSPGFAPPGLASLQVLREQLVVALPEHSAQAACPELGLRDLIDQPLVMFPRRILPSIHDAVFAMYHASGQLPRVAQEAIQMQTIVNLVSAGLGIAWVPESVRQFQRSGVVYRQLAQPVARGTRRVKVPGCETSLVWPAPAGRAGNPVLQRFIDFIGSAPP